MERESTVSTADLQRSWGLRIRELRLKAGLTVTQLAAAVGISAQQLYRIECGEHAPVDERRFLMAQALGVQVADLFAYPDTGAESGRAVS